jgi:3'(2'), 5'-bisphosphate nucleotidase
MAIDDHGAAAELAAAAGQRLLALRREGSVTGKALGAEGDRVAHALLMEGLAERFPGERVRSEESATALELPAPDGRVWIVDPLDGTREYSEGRDDWAVHVALAEDGDPIVGAVALPGLDLVLSTGTPPSLAEPAPVPRMVVSRTRPPAFTDAVAAALGATLVPMGSAGAKISAVVRGEAELYVHGGGQYEWDSAAPVAVALAAGLHASRLDGSPLRYSAPDPWLPDLVVCHPTVAPAVFAALADAVTA